MRSDTDIDAITALVKAIKKDPEGTITEGLTITAQEARDLEIPGHAELTDIVDVAQASVFTGEVEEAFIVIRIIK